MTDPHDFSDPASDLCARCGIGRAWVDLRPRCEPFGATPEPERAPPAPAIADMLDRALGESPWDRIGRRHGR